jgi:hypothetical protein
MTNDQIIADFRRRYAGTFVWLDIHAEQKEVLARVVNIESHPTKLGVIYVDTREYGSLSLNMGSEGHAIKFRYPVTGVFQHEGNSCLFHRRPLRQYRRGICADNCAILDTTRRVGGQVRIIDFNTIQSAFQHKVYSVTDAVRMLNKGEVRSVALEDNLSICLPVTAKAEYLVFHYTHPVAKCDKTGHITQCLEKIYSPLLMKHFL